ncbi:hypothetical protein, partial [Petrachloros mirabilis]
MLRRSEGNVNLAAIVLLLGIVIASVWVWKRLSLETQDYIVDQAVPIVLMAGVCLALLSVAVRAIRRRQQKLRRRAKLLALFEREPAREKRLEIAFTLIELN